MDAEYGIVSIASISDLVFKLWREIARGTVLYAPFHRWWVKSEMLREICHFSQARAAPSGLETNFADVFWFEPRFCYI